MPYALVATKVNVKVTRDAVADAILDRLIQSSHKLTLKGESMRKRKVGANDDQIPIF